MHVTRRITPQTTPDNLKKEAKRWLKDLHSNNPEARSRFERATGKAPDNPVLRDIQHAIALEFGLPGWTALKQTLAAARSVDHYEQLANDMVEVYATSDAAALERINQHYGSTSTADDLRAKVWRLLYKVRHAGGAAEAFQAAEARELIARTSGFSNWSAFTEAVATGQPPTVPPYRIDTQANKISPSRNLSHPEWDAIIGIAKERKITDFHSNGFMSDEVLKRISEMDHVTSLNLEGAREVSDDGLQHLRNMPQLEHLDLSEYPGGKLTDRALEVLRHLPNLRSFKMVWQRGISDAGIANLKFCEKLETVNLMGSPTGDGAIAALRGKPRLYRLETGRLVTDTGLSMLHDFQQFKTLPQSSEPAHLLIDGPFTNNGLANLAGLDGLCGLDLFWHVTAITADGFKVLIQLPNLAFLGCDGELSNDRAMEYIGALPRLRKLRAQGTTATDAGFIALSKSKPLEEFWGRECPNLTGVGFTALSKMPALRALGVSCKNVDDAALRSLPDFPALSNLTPIDVQDAGFLHVGRCQRLERLACMYCRDSTDVATDHIAGLQLKTYYAGMTKITDRSLEVLGRMQSLESIEFWEIKSITDAGLVHLASLPRLREVHLSGIPGVTFAGTSVFPPHVRVEYDA